ncbi:MAG: response regulator, partial [Proteobacteria bacterium]|nr:response regulator [Pseudomonadota bacterium]
LGVKLVEENVGGVHGRWICLDTSNFEVEHRITEEKEQSASLSGVRPVKVRERIKVLVVDDSATVRAIFAKVLAQSAQIEVVGTATDPYDAREKILQLKPDLITLDIEMPRMNGVSFLEKLMSHHPIPVIMVSSLGADGEAAQRCLELGAVEFVQKPSQYDPSLLKDLGDLLIHKVIAASTANLKPVKSKPSPTGKSPTLKEAGLKSQSALNLIVVGGNVGCAEPLASFIKGLASDSPPVVVAASTISGFISTFTQRLQNQCRVELQILRQDQTNLSMGRVYFAPADAHVLVKQASLSGPVAVLERTPANFGQRPSTEKLFSSAAEKFGPTACGVLLSSFSLDGVNGLLKIRESGGVTLVQSPEEASFNATPISAIEKGAADYILTAEEMAPCILQLRNSRVLRAG